MPNVHTAEEWHVQDAKAAPPEDHWSRSFIPTELTQACGNLSRWHWEEDGFCSHTDLGLNLGSAPYQLRDPSKFLNLSELQFPNVTQD